MMSCNRLSGQGRHGLCMRQGNVWIVRAMLDRHRLFNLAEAEPPGPSLRYLISGVARQPSTQRFADRGGEHLPDRALLQELGIGGFKPSAIPATRT